MSLRLLSLLFLRLCRQIHPYGRHIEQTRAVLRHRLRQLPAFLGVLPICLRILHGTEERAAGSQSSFLSTELFRDHRVTKIAFFGEVVWMPAEGVERYKEYAAECLRIAQQTTDDAQKARLLE